MKTVIKIGITFLILAACFNGSRAVLADYSFQDAVHEALLFDPRATDKELVATVMKIAAEHQVPISDDQIQVKTIGSEVEVQMSYTKTIVLIPGVFSKEWTFTPTASTRILTGGRRQPQ
jgi:hypothetical protein